MKTLAFIAITLMAGAFAGTILSTINQVIVEPYIERAIALENQMATSAGDMLNPVQFESYRLWQKGGEIAAGSILGLAIGALFGLVYAYSRTSIPASSEIRKALVLAGIMWFVLFLVPALKYPANPPAVGDPETLLYRQISYLGYLAISGFSALGLAFLYRKMGANQSKKLIIPTTYAAIMLISYLAMPPNPDAITAPMDLVVGFRVASGFAMSLFWGTMAVVLGTFWDKLKPHQTAEISRV